MSTAEELLRRLFEEGTGFFDGEMGYCLGTCDHENILGRGWHTTVGKGGRKYRRYNDKHTNDECVNVSTDEYSPNWHAKDCIYAEVHTYLMEQG